MKAIVPHLWFDTQAKEAVDFYVGLFPDSRILNSSVLHDTPSGDCDMLSFELAGQKFMAISAGPYFKINPAISFMVNFDPSQDPQAKTKIDEVWAKLTDGGRVMMPLQKYDFSERYGWVEDKYGVSWQLILTNPAGEKRPVIVPALLFVNTSYGKAEAATDFYLSVFQNAKRGMLVKYPAGAGPNREGTVMFTDLQLGNQWFVAMDGGGEHAFAFNEAISFLVECETQEEIDYYFEKLSAVPESEQCGWLKDKFGVSWQIVPTRMAEIMEQGSEEQIKRVTEAFLKMKKFDVATLDKAYNL